MRSSVLSVCLAVCLASCFLALGVVAQGCGSSSTEAPAPGADAGVEGGDDASVDDAEAGPENIEQDPNVYPSKHHPLPLLTNKGGPILSAPKTVVVTYVGDAKRDQRRTFHDALTTGVWWQKTMAGYGVGPGTSGGYVELPNTFVTPAVFTDDQIQTLIFDSVRMGVFPAPTSQTIYALYFPPGVSITKQNGASCTEFNAYHSATAVNVPDGGTVNVAYAVMPHCNSPVDPAQNFIQDTISASHEIAEAASDPQPGIAPAFNLDTNLAWIPDQLNGTIPENGDMCEFLADYYVEGGFTLQRSWSNGAAMNDDTPCAPAPAGRIYFAGAVRTSTITFAGKKIDGYVAVKRGSSVDVVIDVFSKAKLGHDLKLLTGRVSPGFTNGNIILPPLNGIKADLSTTTAHNGNGVIMTISAPANAAGGEFRMVVRALYDTFDWNDWPIIVLVK